MLPELPLSILEFTYETVDPIAASTMSGALWHGVFGRALHHQSCVIRDIECKQCMLLHQCDYPYLFHRIAPPDSEMMRGKEIPAPHVFRYKQGDEGMLNTGEAFTVELVVIGQAYKKTAAIIRAMLLAGIGGLGKQRSRARLLHVKQTRPGETPIDIMQQDRIIAEPQPQHPQSPGSPVSASVNFFTPYKPSGKKRPSELDTGRLMMAIIRRTSLLQYFYTGKRLVVDFRKLKGHTDIVRIVSEELCWQPSRRYSASHGNAIDTSGWIGSLELDIETTPELWPYLWLGQWLGVGKNASMGFGRYTIL